jgi:hypothetical protein
LRTKTALFACIIVLSCKQKQSKKTAYEFANPMIGTWQLLKGTLIENGDTVITDYTRTISFIKIINETHFAFLQHDTRRGKEYDTSFVAGGGKYTLKDSIYTEQLEYCNARQWEGHEFNFTVSFNNDTLTQYGIEKIESAGINRVNIEKYVRFKN